MSFITNQILSKLFPDINWFTKIEHPPKISRWFSVKYSIQFVPGFDFINIQIQINCINSLNSSVGPLVLRFLSTRMTSSTKYFGRKSTKVKILMNYFFVP